MFNTLRNQNATNQTLIETNPEALREIASRLELSEQNCNSGQYVTIPLTEGISLCYRVKKSCQPQSTTVSLPEALPNEKAVIA